MQMVGCAVLCCAVLCCAVLCCALAPAPRSSHKCTACPPPDGSGKSHLARALGRQLHSTQLAAAWAPAAAARCTGLTAAQHSGEASKARQGVVPACCAEWLTSICLWTSSAGLPLDEQAAGLPLLGVPGSSTHLLRGVLEALATDVVQHSQGLTQLAVRHLEAHGLQAEDDFEELQSLERGDRAAALTVAADNNPFEPCQPGPGWLFQVLQGSGRGSRTRACLLTTLTYTFLGRAGTSQG